MAIKFGSKNVIAVYKGSKKVEDIIRNGRSYLKAKKKTIFEQNTGMTMLAFINNGYAEDGKAYDSAGQEIPNWDTYWNYNQSSNQVTLKDKTIKQLPTEIPVIVNKNIITNRNSLFSGCSSITTIDLSNVDNSNVTDMRYMFRDCTFLNTIIFGDFDTSKITSFNYLFYGCSNLVNLDVSKFDTSNVTNMSSMFYECRKLQSVDLNNWNVSNVTDMTSMFRSCAIITEIKFDKWITKDNVQLQEFLFNCGRIANLDFSNWNTTNTSSYYDMFKYADNIKTIIANRSMRNLFSKSGINLKSGVSITYVD